MEDDEDLATVEPDTTEPDTTEPDTTQPEPAAATQVADMGPNQKTWQQDPTVSREPEETFVPWTDETQAAKKEEFVPWQEPKREITEPDYGYSMEGVPVGARTAEPGQEVFKPWVEPESGPAAMARETAHGAGPAVAAAVGGSFAGGAAGALTANPLAILGGGLIGGITAGVITDISQEQVLDWLGKNDAAIREANREAHPWWTAAGTGVSNLAGFGTGVKNAAVGIGSRLFGAGLMGGTEAVIQGVHGTPIEQAAPQIGASTLAGAIAPVPRMGPATEEAGARIAKGIREWWKPPPAAPDTVQSGVKNQDWTGPPAAVYHEGSTPFQEKFKFGDSGQAPLPQEAPPGLMTRQDWVRLRDLAEDWDNLGPKQKAEYDALIQKSEAVEAKPQIGGGETQADLFPAERPAPEPMTPADRKLERELAQLGPDMTPAQKAQYQALQEKAQATAEAPPGRPTGEPELPLEPPGVHAPPPQGQLGLDIEAPDIHSRNAMPDSGGAAKTANPPTGGQAAPNYKRYAKWPAVGEGGPKQPEPYPHTVVGEGLGALATGAPPGPARGINVMQPGQVEPTLAAGLRTAHAEAPAPKPQTDFERPGPASTRTPDWQGPPAPIPRNQQLVPYIPRTTVGVTEPTVPANHTRMYQGARHPPDVFTTDRRLAEQRGPARYVDVHNERGRPFFTPSHEPNTFTTRSELYRRNLKPIRPVETQPVAERPHSSAPPADRGGPPPPAPPPPPPRGGQPPPPPRGGPPPEGRTPPGARLSSQAMDEQIEAAVGRATAQGGGKPAAPPGKKPGAAPPVDKTGTKERLAAASEHHAQVMESALDDIEHLIEAGKNKGAIAKAAQAARDKLAQVPKEVIADDPDYFNGFKTSINKMVKPGYVTGTQAEAAKGDAGAIAELAKRAPAAAPEKPAPVIPTKEHPTPAPAVKTRAKATPAEMAALEGEGLEVSLPGIKAKGKSEKQVAVSQKAEPKSLYEHIKSLGGIKPDDKGELKAAFGGHKSGLYMQLARKNGMPLDRIVENVARGAPEERYFHEGADINDLLRALKGSREHFPAGEEAPRETAAQAERREVENQRHTDEIETQVAKYLADPDLDLVDFDVEKTRPRMEDLMASGEAKTPAEAYEKAVAEAEKPAPEKPAPEKGAEGKPQEVMPGFEKAPDKALAQRAADRPLKPKTEQKGSDFGMFADRQEDLMDLAAKPAAKPKLEVVPKTTETGRDPAEFRMTSKTDIPVKDYEKRIDELWDSKPAKDAPKEEVATWRKEFNAVNRNAAKAVDRDQAVVRERAELQRADNEERYGPFPDKVLPQHEFEERLQTKPEPIDPDAGRIIVDGDIIRVADAVRNKYPKLADEIDELVHNMRAANTNKDIEELLEQVDRTASFIERNGGSTTEIKRLHDILEKTYDNLDKPILEHMADLNKRDGAYRVYKETFEGIIDPEARWRKDVSVENMLKDLEHPDQGRGRAKISEETQKVERIAYDHAAEVLRNETRTPEAAEARVEAKYQEMKKETDEAGAAAKAAAHEDDPDASFRKFLNMSPEALEKLGVDASGGMTNEEALKRAIASDAKRKAKPPPEILPEQGTKIAKRQVEPIKESKTYTPSRDLRETMEVKPKIYPETEKFAQAQKDYRARKIGDDEFLAAKAKYEAWLKETGDKGRPKTTLKDAIKNFTKDEEGGITLPSGKTFKNIGDAIKAFIKDERSGVVLPKGNVFKSFSAKIKAFIRDESGAVIIGRDKLGNEAGFTGKTEEEAAAKALKQKFTSLYRKDGSPYTPPPPPKVNPATKAVQAALTANTGGAGKPPGGTGKPPGGPPPKGPAPKPTPAPAPRPPGQTPEQAILARVAKPGSWVDKMPRTLAEAKAAWRKFYTSTKNAMDPIEQLKKLSDKPLAIEKDPGVLARLTKGIGGRFDTQMGKKGLFSRQWTGGTYDVITKKRTGGSLKEIAEKIEKAGPDNFLAYAISKHAIELEGHGFKTGVPMADANATVAKHGAKMGPIMKELVDFQSRVLDNLTDLVGAKGIAEMKAKYPGYIPFYRAILGDTDLGRSIGAGLQVRDPIHAMKGSDLKLMDPMDSIIKNTMVFTELAERNRVGMAMEDLNASLSKDKQFMKEVHDTYPIDVSAAEINKQLKKEGIPQQVIDGMKIFRPEKFSPDSTHIRVYRDGKAKIYEVPENLGTAINNLDAQTMNVLTRLAAIPARTLRAGATLGPEFMLRNPWRDQFTATIQTPKGYIPIWDFAKGLGHVLEGTEKYHTWLRNGGANANLVSIDRRLLDLDGKTLAGRVANVVTTPFHKAQLLSELMENATRMGVSARLQAQGKHPVAAAYVPRESTLDFQRMGSHPLIKAFNLITAFANARIEGVDRLARAFRDNPGWTSLAVFGGITLPSALVWMYNHNDPRVQELEQWQKDIFWIFPTDNWKTIPPELKEYAASLTPAWKRTLPDGTEQYNAGHLIRWPKPFGEGMLFGSIPERILEAWFGNNPYAFHDLGKTIRNALNLEWSTVVPQFALPTVEQFANKSLFTDRPIVTPKLEKMRPEDQHAWYTSDTSQAIGKALRAVGLDERSSLGSPMVIDNYIRAWTGAVGQYIVKGVDAGIRQGEKLAGYEPRPVDPASAWSDIPGLKAFIARFPTSSPESINHFYEEYNNRKMDNASVKQLRTTDPEKAEARMQEGGLWPGTAVAKALAATSNMIETTRNDKEMSAENKRIAMDLLYLLRIEQAKAGLEGFAQDQRKKVLTPVP